MFWESLITFFSGVWKVICSFIPDAGIWPIFFSQCSPVLTSSCRGQGQHKGQSNPLYLFQLCKLKVVGNVLVLSVKKEPKHVHPLSYLLKEKDEYVSPWIYESLVQNEQAQWPQPLVVNVSLSFLGQIKQDSKVHCFNFCKVSRAVGNQEVPTTPGDMLLSWICPIDLVWGQILLWDILMMLQQRLIHDGRGRWLYQHEHDCDSLKPWKNERSWLCIGSCSRLYVWWQFVPLPSAKSLCSCYVGSAIIPFSYSLIRIMYIELPRWMPKETLLPIYGLKLVSIIFFLFL